jgi:hypothetical protein
MNPGTVTNRGATAGLQAGETIVGIDFRPANNLLYALGSTSRVYILDTLTAAAVQVGVNPFTPSLNGTAYGFDINPTADLIRVHSDAEQNLRLDPKTGATAATDSMLAYAVTDLNNGANPNIVGTAYTNSFAGASTTALYAIDANRDVLVILPNPNNGKMTTVGPLNLVNANNFTGFDIAGDTGVAYAAFVTSGKSTLYTVNLQSAITTFVGQIGNSAAVHSIAVAP